MYNIKEQLVRLENVNEETKAIVNAIEIIEQGDYSSSKEEITILINVIENQAESIELLLTILLKMTD